MMRTRCYFDMLDTCVGFDLGNIVMTLGAHHQIVDAGTYDLPLSFNPLGQTAFDLFQFGAIDNG